MKKLVIILFAALSLFSCKSQKNCIVHASFTTDKPKYDYGESVVITNTSTVENGEIGLCKWEWDGNVSYEEEIGPLVFQMDGEYPVKLTVYADLGAGQDTYTGKIIVSGGEVTFKYFVSNEGAGKKDGSTAGNAISLEQFKEMVSSETAVPDRIDGVRFEFLEGTYELNTQQLIIGNYSRPVSLSIKGAGTDKTIFTGKSAHTIIAVQNNVTLDLLTINFTNAISAGANSGGAVYLTSGMNGSCNINNCLFTNCVAKNGTGAAVVCGYGDKNLTITRCIFNDNFGSGASIDVDGGSIEHLITNPVIVENCVISNANNTAVSGKKSGPAVKVRYGAAKFIDCVFSENKCTVSDTDPSEQRGSALWANNDAKVVIKGCKFTNNVSDAADCPALFANSNSEVSISDNAGEATSFTSNSSSTNGAAILFKSSGKLEISNTNFSSNSADGNGAAIAHDGTGVISCTDCLFEGNKSALLGGAFNNVSASGKAHFTSCQFINNSASSGGAVASIASGTDALSTFNKCSFRLNHCTNGTVGGGAAIVNSENAVMYLNACPMYTNYSNKYGTAIDVCLGTICVNNSTIYFNNATNTNTSGNDFQTQVRVGKAKDTPGSLLLTNTCVFSRNGRNFDPAKGTAVIGNAAQVIVHHENSTLMLVNNILASASVSATSGGSIRTNGVDMKGKQLFKYNKMMHSYSGGWTGKTPSAEDGNCMDIYATDTYLEGFFDPVNLLSPTVGDCKVEYFPWKGKVKSDQSASFASLDAVKTAINEADAGFYSWLSSISALDVDQRGKQRTATGTWPGAYDGGVSPDVF